MTYEYMRFDTSAMVVTAAILIALVQTGRWRGTCWPVRCCGAELVGLEPS